MRWKSDWEEAKTRLTALWHHELLDRPCLSVCAPRDVVDIAPLPEPVDDEARWLDPGYRTALTQRQLETTWWGGEAIPSVLQLGNWVLCLGGTPCFSPHTIWFETVDVDFENPSPFRHDPDSEWTRKNQTLIAAVCQMAGKDDFLMGSPAALPANDLLSMLMGTEPFLYALMDHPEWMEDAIMTGARDQCAIKRDLQDYCRSQGHQYWYGNAGWMPFWAPEPFFSTQSDVSCMLSPELFDRFVLPEIDLYGQQYDALWYHLDGGDAKQHLPRLLSLPYMKVIQYVPAPAEPPNGPAHLEMYRAIQEADKIVHVAVSSQHVEPLLKELDPARLMLHTSCSSPAEGERLLEQSAVWAGC